MIKLKMKSQKMREKSFKTKIDRSNAAPYCSKNYCALMKWNGMKGHEYLMKVLVNIMSLLLTARWTILERKTMI